MTEVEIGLRERKRLATRRTIQRAVLTLAAKRGFDNVTVEEVSREADIAPRTFFNYFSTKEAALIPDLPQAPDQASVARFVAGEPHGELWQDFGEFIAVQLSDFDADREMLKLRHCVFRDSPHLSKLHFSNLRELEDRFTTSIRLRVESDASRQNGEVDEADLLVLRGIASGVMRTAWIAWAQSEDEVSLPDRVRAVFGHVSDVLSRFN